MRILGIDPGLATLGYGIIERYKGNLRCLEFGVIKTPQDVPIGKRLALIQRELSALIGKFSPEIACVETLFFFKNQKTIIQIGQVHGILALTFYRRKVPVFHYPPLKVKNVLTGNGRADKKEVEKKTRQFLKLPKESKPDDAYDALAVALCHLLNPKKSPLKKH